MKDQSIQKFKWFWAWQDEKEEAWLAEMAREGLHLEDVTLPALYHFRKGTPAEYVYRLDFQTLKSKDRASYLQLFADAGWEHIGDMGGWVYFRHRVDGTEIPEIYSDLESKLGKYQRVMLYLVVFLPIVSILLPINSQIDYFGPVVLGAIELFSFLLILIFSYSLVMLFRRINQLKKRIKE